ncbi:MAG: glycosyltransferase family 4 protein [Patescibacteria group bacterium]|nr:glycosyltransferase family 4 protein [Patescibacteria group bacterium]
MKIVFLSRFFYPHIGGVEKQVLELSRRLITKGHQVRVVTTQHERGLKKTATKDGLKIIRLTPPPLKYLGLLYIWGWLVGHINLFKSADIIHAHSVLIWYWPLKLLLPKKPIYVTFHGWEGIYPIPKKNILIRKIDAWVARKNITIHDYVTKHYGIKADEIMYTAVDLPKATNFKKDYRRLIYVGRLDEDTGLRQILQALSFLPGFRVDWCGDGPLAGECKKFGPVHGFTDPRPFYQTAFICLSPGVTSILEAFTYKCLVATTYNNPVKKDYLLMTPFKNWIVVKSSPQKLAEAIKHYSADPASAQSRIRSAYAWVKTQNWDRAVKLYEAVWRQ